MGHHQLACYFMRYRYWHIFFDYALFGTQISLLTIVGMFVVALAIVFYRRFPAEKVQRLAR